MSRTTTERNAAAAGAFPGRTAFDWWRDGDGPHKLVTWDPESAQLLLNAIEIEALRAINSDAEVPVPVGPGGPVPQPEASPRSDNPAPSSTSLSLGEEFLEARRWAPNGIKFQRTDEATRTCELTVGGLGAGDQISMSLRITFPSLYPNRAPPSFHFGADGHRPQSILQNRK